MMMSGLALGSMSQSMKLTYFGDPPIFPLAWKLWMIKQFAGDTLEHTGILASELFI